MQRLLASECDSCAAARAFEPINQLPLCKKVILLLFRYEQFRMREDNVDVEANGLAEELTSLGRSTADHKPI